MKSSRPRSLLSTIALAVPTSLLAIGWLLASVREEATRADQERRDLAAEAHAVSAAVSEGLEELRAREDERPYYLYTYYFAPPDVLSVGESLAVSPLGRVPTDARLLGHFQIDPGAIVRSPLESSEAPAASRARGQLVIEAIKKEFASALVLLTQATTPAPPDKAEGSAAWNQVQNIQEYGQKVLSGIRDVEARRPGAENRAYNRKTPERQRVNVGDLNDNNESGNARIGLGNEDGQTDRKQLGNGNEHAADRGRSGGLPQTDQSPPELQARLQAWRSDGTVAAEYSPMVFRRDGEQAILYRRVSTDGASSVQGALLDLGALRSSWLPAVARRHATPGTVFSFVPAGTEARCLASARLPSPIDDLAVCASGSGRVTESALRWQVLALCGVLGLVGAATAARLRALRRAEELAGIERAFIASVSHELRTPLTTFRLHAEMLQEGLVSEARKPRVLAQLVEESQRLARLIEDVLTFGRLSEGEPRLACRDADLGAHVRGLVERERPRLESRGLTIDMVDSPEGVRACFDPGAVDQILTNLLDNALKYGVGGEHPRVLVAVVAGEQRATLRVVDEGPGVPASERDLVFDRFYRSPVNQGSHVAGTGLGLAIVRGLSRAMGGEARLVDPPVGRGCAVEVSLPSASPG